MGHLAIFGLLLAVPFAIAFARTTNANGRETTDNLGGHYDAARLTSVTLDVPVGEVAIEDWERSEISVVMDLRCPSKRSKICSEASKVKLTGSGMGSERLRLKVEGWPKSDDHNLEARILLRMPSSLKVDVKLRVGQLRAEGLAADLKADVGVGSIKLSMPQSAVASAILEGGVGQAVLHARDKQYESSGVGVKTLRWNEGAGHARIQVKCGVGNIHVTLQ